MHKTSVEKAKRYGQDEDEDGSSTEESDEERGSCSGALLEGSWVVIARVISSYNLY